MRLFIPSVFRKPCLRATPAVLLLSACLLLTGAEPGPWKTPAPSPIESGVAKVVAHLIARLHYERRPLDDAMSAKLFDAYFDRLDHERSFFLASDIEEFSHFRDILDDLIKQGKLDFAYDVYGRYVQRVRERVEYVTAHVNDPMDFTANEEILIDRSKQLWCPDRAALDQVWRLKLKNQLLTNILIDEAQKREAAAKPKDEVKPPAEQKPEGGEAAAPKPKTPAERLVQFYDRFLRVLEDNESMDILEIFLSALTEEYDPHSVYMAPTSQEEFDISMKLSLQGIGAVLTNDDGYVKIVEVVPGGPADIDGRLQAGDRIVAVAQDQQEPVDVINMPLTKVVHMIRGPKATKVTLTVLGADKGLSSIPVTLQLTRDEVKLTEQEAKSEYRDPASGQPLPADPTTAAVTANPPAGSIAVITLPSFYSDFEGRRTGSKEFKSATRDVKRLLEAAKTAKAAAVVLDLRSDGGGSLDEAVSLAGLFISKGPLVQVRTAERDVRVQSDPDDTTVYDGPLVVLVNRLSASASEIVAAALQDYHRAVIVGDEATHGKGTVQTIYNLGGVFPKSVLQDRNPGSLKFTIAKFYRVTGGSTQQKGVNPDIVFPSFTDYMELGERELPTALPYDEIQPLEVSPTDDIRPFLPPIKEHSQERVNHDPQYQELEKAIRRYGELKQMKTLSLNKEKREALQKEEDGFSKTIQEIASSRRRPYSGKNSPKNEKAAPATRDLILEEASHIASDLACMEQKGLTPVAPVAAVDVTAPAPTVR